jgi:hypothetical protein
MQARTQGGFPIAWSHILVGVSLFTYAHYPWHIAQLVTGEFIIPIRGIYVD